VDRKADMRRGAMDSFNREWDNAIDATIDLERVFTRMSEQAARLAESGCHMHIIMPSEQGQKWWVTFQEAHGNLIPVHPEDAPMMPLEAA